MARISSGGESVETSSGTPSAFAIWGLMSMDLRSRDHTPPPSLINSVL